MYYGKLLKFGVVLVALSVSTVINAVQSESHTQKVAGYYEVSIYELKPDEIDASGDIRTKAINKALEARTSSGMLRESPGLRALQDEKLQAAKTRMSEPRQLPNADLKYRLVDMEKAKAATQSKRESLEDAYVVPKISSLENCKLELKSSDRRLALGKYGSSMYFYNCDGEDVFLAAHVLQQMRIVFVKELLNTELDRGIKGGLTRQQDDIGHSYTSLRWASNQILHVVEVNGVGKKSEDKAKLIANELIAKDGI